MKNMLKMLIFTLLNEITFFPQAQTRFLVSSAERENSACLLVVIAVAV